MNRVLVVVDPRAASLEAFQLTEALGSFGYSVDICSRRLPSSETEFVKADVELDDNTSVSNYKGVVFLDDGGNPDLAVELAKKAGDAGMVVGGYMGGCEVLSTTGLLDGKFIPDGLPFDVEKAKISPSPSVRCDNVVTSTDYCMDGFAILLVDALGGEVKKIVKGGEDGPVPVVAAMVVSRLERWPEYWTLSQRLSSRGVSLVVADWSAIDTKKKLVHEFLLLSGSGKKVVHSTGPIPIPPSAWFKQTSIGIRQTIMAVKDLECVGVKNVNSAEALSLSSDKIASSEAMSIVCDQGNPRKFDPLQANEVRKAAQDLLRPGIRWAKPTSSSLGHKVIKIVGQGDRAIVSRRIGSVPRHKVLSLAGLEKFLSAAYDDSFIVQDDLGAMMIGDKSVEFRFVMRRLASGWQPSCEIARAGLLISNPSPFSPGHKLAAMPAQQASRMIFGDDWEKALGQARDTALAACVAFQASLSDPDGVSELGVDIVCGPDGARVIEVNGVPDLTFVDEAMDCEDGLRSFASAAYHKPLTYEPMLRSEWEKSRGDMAGPMDQNVHGRDISRVLRDELAVEGIHEQPDGSFAIPTGPGEVRKMQAEEAEAYLRDEARWALDRVRETRGLKPRDVEMRKKLMHKKLHRLMCFRGFRDRTSKLRRQAQADISSKTMGPFSNMPEAIDVATPWSKMGLEDYDKEKMELNRPRRKPEYTNQGWYTTFYLGGQRDPYDISRIESLINEGSIYEFVRLNWE